MKQHMPKNINISFQITNLETLITNIVNVGTPTITQIFETQPNPNNNYIKSLGETPEAIISKLITELNTVPPVKSTTFSEEYNPILPYIPRSQRKEWAQIGLLGKIYVRDDGTCVVGGKCDCN